MSTFQAEAMHIAPTTPNPNISASAVEVSGSTATEVVTLWGDTVVGVKHFPHTGTYGTEKYISTRAESALAGAFMVAGGVVFGPIIGQAVRRVYHPQVIPKATHFTVGEDPKSDVWITSDLLQGKTHTSILEVGSQGSRISLLKGMTGDVELADGTKHDARQMVPGCESFDLPVGARARLRLGEFTFLISSVTAGKIPAVGADTDWTAITYTGLSFLVHAMFLSIVFLIPPDPYCLSHDMLDRDNRFVRYALIPTQLEEPPEESWIERTQQDEEQGGQGRRHEGDEGALGRQDSKRTNNRFGIKGPALNTNPQMSRERLEKLAEEGGILSVLNNRGPTSPFGVDRELGNDPESALGALMGDQVGANFGVGGLGLRGTGRGGGGDGLGTIGLGRLNTIGHGAGGGRGDGYGRGNGRLRGRQGSGPEVSIRGTASIRGSLSREVIRRHIRRNIPAIRFCYEQQLSRRPDLTGRVQVQFVIAPSGAVQTANVVSSTLGDPTVEGCVARAVQRINFPAPDGGVVIVTYPFMFRSINN